MKFVTRCQEHMANLFFLNDQQAAEIAWELKISPHFGTPRVIKVFVNKF